MNSQRKALTLSLLSLSLCAAPVFAENWTGEAKDAWIDGKLESSYLLNSELNNFNIDTEVAGGNVTLTGSVPSQAHKELASEIATNLDGVLNVNNQLAIGDEPYERSDADRDFSTRFHDMTTSVSLKSRYALSDDLSATAIDIQVESGVVTLEGEVESDAESLLAEEIASGYDYVSEVDNRLRVVAGR